MVTSWRHDDVIVWRCHNVARNMRFYTANSNLQSELRSEVYKLSYKHLCHDVEPWHFKSVIASWRQKISWHNFSSSVPTTLAMCKTNFKNLASAVLEEMSTVRFLQNVQMTSWRHDVITYDVMLALGLIGDQSPTFRPKHDRAIL
jgi:hypothetical protein